jgi:hypothetical protein
MSKLPPFTLNHQDARASKIGHVSTDRHKAQSPGPANVSGHTEHRTQVSTYFTKIPQPGQQPEILYNGDRQWANVTMTLETAGPVAVGQSQQLSPVLSGKGVLLETDVPFTLTIAKGTRLYILSTSINRVKLVIEPFAWLETITGLIGTLIGAVSSAPQSVRDIIASKL